MRTIHHRSAFLIPLLSALVLTPACEEDAVCTSSEECSASQVCVEGSCREACNSDLDCLGYEQCSQGACLPRVDAGAIDAAGVDVAVPVDAGGHDRMALDRAADDRSAADTVAIADSASADAAAADAAAPDSSAPDTSAPDTSAPDTSAPDTSAPDASAPDTSAPDTSAPDTSAPDTSAPDTSAPDTSAPPCALSCAGCCIGETCYANSYPTCGVSGADCSLCAAMGDLGNSCSAAGSCVCSPADELCSAPEACGPYGCCHPTDITLNPALEFDPVEGRSAEVAPIDGDEFLIHYNTTGGVGVAAILTVDTAAGTVSMGTPITVADMPNYVYGALERVDQAHYLAAYNGEGDDGYAVVIEVAPADHALSAGTPLEFDTVRGTRHALAQIDGQRVLGIYNSSGAGEVVVFTVDGSDNSVSVSSPGVFDTMAESCTLAKVDPTHYLAAYRGPGPTGRALVFEVDLSTDEVSWGTPLEFEETNVNSNTLQQISAARFLLAYGDVGRVGQLRMLEVDTSTNGVSVVASHVFGPTQGDHAAIAPISGPDYLLAYRGDGDDGWVQVLTADAVTGAMSSSGDVEFEPTFLRHITLHQIDPGHFLSTNEGPDLDGFARIFEPPCE